VLLFSKQTSLSSTSLLLFRVGENNRALTHNNKEEAKKLEHKSGGVKKHEQRNCSLNLRSFLSSVVFSVLFRANVEIIPSVSVEISSVSQRRSAFPHY